MTVHRQPARVGIALVFWIALGVAFSGVASAHALLVSSSPEPGARLGTAPGLVTLRYSEALSGQLSGVTVTDPTGRGFKGSGAGSQMTALLTTNAPGPYRVDWVAVSLDDGHATRGSFQFTVIASGTGALQTSSRPGPLGLATSVARGVLYVSLLLAIGSLLIGRLARRPPPIDWIRSPIRIALAALLASAVLTVAGDAYAGSANGSVHGVLVYLTSGLPGLSRVLLLPLAGLALLAALGRGPVWPPILGAVVVLAAAGHPADVHPSWLGISLDALHLIAAGLWAGAIMALATQRPLGGWLGPDGRRLLDRFSPIAISAFLATVGLGVVQAYRFLPSVSALVNSAYGRVLLVKIVLVAAMVPLSLLAWRRIIAPRAEAVLAVFVIGAATLLSAYPIPLPSPAQATVVPPRAVDSALPHGGELTMGDHVGPVLVGLSLSPAKPGPNQVFVYLLPIDASAAQISARLIVRGRSVPMSACGPNCRTARLSIQGPERLVVSLGPFTSSLGHSPAGSTTFEVPSLPVPDATRLLNQAQVRMHALRTFRLNEVLTGGLGATIRSGYAFQAPDRIEIHTNGQRTFLIGGIRYLRPKPDGPWQIESGGPVTPVPSFIWDYFKPYVDPRIVGSDTVNAVRTQILVFSGHVEGTPIWFRLWVDDSGLVRRAEMRADGHFMDHRYYDFDAPIDIVAPTTAGGG